MINSKVKNGHAFLYCTECNKEHQMLQYVYDERYKAAMIDYEKTTSQIEAFATLHSICKPEEVPVQLEIA